MGKILSLVILTLVAIHGVPANPAQLTTTQTGAARTDASAPPIGPVIKEPSPLARCTTCPDPIIFPNVEGPAFQGFPGTGFLGNFCSGSNATSVLCRALGGESMPPIGNGGEPPGGSCLCCVSHWHDEGGNCHSHRDCNTGTGTGGGASGCDSSSVAQPPNVVVCYHIPCADADSDGECAGDQDESDEDLDGHFGDDAVWGDVDGDGLPNIFDAKNDLTGKGNPGAMLPPDLAKDKIDDWLESQGIDAHEIDFDKFTDGELDRDGDGAVTYGELFTAVVEKFQGIIDGFSAGMVNGNFDIGDPNEWVEAMEELRSFGQFARNFGQILGAEFFGGAEGLAAFLDGIGEILAGIDQVLGALAGDPLSIDVTVDPSDPTRTRFTVTTPTGKMPDWAVGLLNKATDGIAGLDVTWTVNGQPLPSSPDVPGNGDSTTGDPVDTWQGAFLYEATDLQIGSVAIKRFYDSRSTGLGIFGRGWSASLLESNLNLIERSDGTTVMAYSAGDGTYQYFVEHRPNGQWDGSYEGRLSSYGKIIPYRKQFAGEASCTNQPLGYILRQPNGTMFYFCPPSRYAGIPGAVCWLSKMVSPDGTVALAIDRNRRGKPVALFDQEGRKYSFLYAKRHELVTAIEGPGGIKIQYSYDLNSNLSSGAPSSGIGGAAGNPVAIDPVLKPKRAFKRELSRVDHQPSLILNESGQVIEQGSFEKYSYHEHPDGFAANAESLLNHNLFRIENPAGLVVEVEYYTDENDYSFDRVKLHRDAAGRSVLFQYDRTPSPAVDAYGHQIVHKTTALFERHMFDSDGQSQFEKESFHHDREGRLLRQEIHNGSFAADGTTVSGPAPGEPAQWATVYGYDAEFLLRKQCQTTDQAPLGGRCTEYLYDSGNPDRFQKANLLEIKALRDPANPVGPAQIVANFTNDPLSAQPSVSVDSLGRVTRNTFDHQEMSQQAASALLHVRDWSINLNAAPGHWGLGDVNGDGKVGGSYHLVRVQPPAVTVEGPDGPGSAQSIQTEKIFRYAKGLLVAERDLAGVWTEFRYDSRRQLIEKTVDPAGLALRESYGYDALGRKTSLLAADGSRAEMLYDWRGHLLESRSLVQAGSSQQIVQQNFYNRSGLLVGAASPFYSSAGAVTYYAGMTPFLGSVRSYDALENVIAMQRRIASEDGTQTGTWSASYDVQGRVVSVTTPSSTQFPASSALAVTYLTERDPRGLAQSIHRVGEGNIDLGTSRFEYDEYGKLVREISAVDSDQNGTPDTTTHAYDGFGRRIETISPIGLKTISTLDDAGRLLVSETKNLVGGLPTVGKTERGYDAWDRLISEKAHNYKSNGSIVGPGEGPSFLLTLHGYGVRDTFWTVLNPGPEQILTRNAYDSIGRLVSQLHGPAGGVGEYGFVHEQIDAVGRVLTKREIHNRMGQTGAVNPSEALWLQQFDLAGRLLQSVDPNGGVTSYSSYSAGGMTLSMTDPIGKTVNHAYDSANRLRRTTEIGADGTSRTTRSRYDIANNLIEVVDGKGQATAYGYDGLGRRISRRFADGSQISYFYDKADRLERTDEPGGVSIQRQFDAANRIETILATGADAIVQRVYWRDASGLYEYIEENNGAIAVERIGTSLGQTLSEQLFRAGLFPKFTASYDGRGLPQRIVYPSGNRVTNHYDALGKLDRIDHTIGANGPNTVVASMGNPYGTGFLTAMLANGARVDNSFDSLGRKKTKIATNSANAILAGESVSYDAVDNVSCRTNAVTGRVDTFRYDGLDRLTDWFRGVQNCAQFSGAQRHATWTHDGADNLFQSTDSSGPSVAPVVNALNQYMSFDPICAPISYDPRGQERTRIQGADSWSWKWDALGRPIETTVLEGGVTKIVRWIHDPMDRLVARRVDGVETTFHHLGNTILASSDPAAGTKEYVPGPHGIWRLRNNAERLYLHLDTTRNVVAAHDGVTTLEAYEYDPYGLPRNPATGAELTSSIVGNDLLFLGKPYFFDMEISHLTARLYSTELGRFVSRDPLEEMGGWNLYNYAKQNPLRFADPSGLKPMAMQNDGPTAGSGNLEGQIRQRIQGIIDASESEIRSAYDQACADFGCEYESQVSFDQFRQESVDNIIASILDEAIKTNGSSLGFSGGDAMEVIGIVFDFSSDTWDSWWLSMHGLDRALSTEATWKTIGAFVDDCPGIFKPSKYLGVLGDALQMGGALLDGDWDGFGEALFQTAVPIPFLGDVIGSQAWKGANIMWNRTSGSETFNDMATDAWTTF